MRAVGCQRDRWSSPARDSAVTEYPDDRLRKEIPWSVNVLTTSDTDMQVRVQAHNYDARAATRDCSMSLND
jgi:hypothetical protein